MSFHVQQQLRAGAELGAFQRAVIVFTIVLSRRRRRRYPCCVRSLIIPRVCVGYKMVTFSYPASTNRIIVLLNLISFLKPSKLENYTQIFIQFHFNFTKRSEVDTVYNKEKIKWNARFYNHSWMKIWTLSKRLCWTKFTTISLSKLICPMKKIQQSWTKI